MKHDDKLSFVIFVTKTFFSFFEYQCKLIHLFTLAISFQLKKRKTFFHLRHNLSIHFQITKFGFFTIARDYPVKFKSTFHKYTKKVTHYHVTFNREHVIFNKRSLLPMYFILTINLSKKPKKRNSFYN